MDVSPAVMPAQSDIFARFVFQLDSNKFQLDDSTTV